MSDLFEFPLGKPILLDNETCVYCGKVLRYDATKEHVIGRRFVPKGKLNRQWNLILRACSDCNNIKSTLENDLSAITMHPDAWGEHASDDGALVADALRKAKRSISARTGRPVKDSEERVTVSAALSPGATFTFSLSAPPQAESERVFALARLQLMAFFYWLTYDRLRKRGGYWGGGFYPVMEAVRSDWGNVVNRAFMDTVVSWEPRLLANGADGYFKVAIRRHPHAVCWSWALEWNKNYRIIGFFGEQGPAEEVVKKFPPLPTKTIVEGPNRWARHRSEVRLDEAHDRLFTWADNS